MPLTGFFPAIHSISTFNAKIEKTYGLPINPYRGLIGIINPP
jgi:hypothetical protein